jgi:hypothetical protein
LIQSTRVICGAGTTVPTKLIAVGFRNAVLVTSETLEPPRASDALMKMETVREVPAAGVGLGTVVHFVEVGVGIMHNFPVRTA